jgi:tetratricopeptide (TPR) repeat protein
MLQRRRIGHVKVVTFDQTVPYASGRQLDMHLGADSALADAGSAADQQHLGLSRHPEHLSEPSHWWLCACGMVLGRLAGWETAGVPFLADDLGAWLVAVLADAGRRKLTGLVLGSDQERALRSAAATAIRLTAGELFPDDGELAGQVGLVISEVFRAPVPGVVLAGHGSVLEGLRAGIAGELAVLDDASITGTGRSSAQVLSVAGGVLAERLTAHLLREIVVRGSGGGPLFALASQLNDDFTHLQVRRLEGVVDRRADELLDAVARLDGTRAAAPAALAQLPPPAVGFTGRVGDLAVLAGLLDPAGAAGPVVVSAVAGLAGVGKTALAVQAGHAAQQRGWFGGGVLFIDLHGYDGAPVEPGQALDALLRALGVPAEHVPPTVEERAGLYRSVLADITSPVLVIVDNASSEAQVRPLLPGAGPHKVLVTSRHTLAGLGARLVDVTVLDPDAAVGLLDAALRAARPDDDRISADPGAAVRLAETCGGLPLALQITAALLTGDPALSAVELAQELAAESGRLERLAYDDGSGTAAPSVAAAFELSYRRLEEVPARVFRLLSASPGTDISTGAAAALADLPAGTVRRVLAALARAHLAEAAPGAAGRWRMHDLVRLYARQLSDACADADGREEARDRLLDFYLRRAEAADAHLRALPGMAVPEEFTGRDAALEWLDSERASLVAAVSMAADTGRDEVALRLPLVLAEYFSWRRRFDDLIATTATSMDAARRLGDHHREGDALTNLGSALLQVRRFEEAITACQDAAAIYRETGDRHGEGRALNNLGLALREVRRFEEAITAHQEDLAICREAGDRHGEGGALSNLGLVLREMRRFEEAITASQDAATIYRETGDRHGEGVALSNLGLALRAVRRFEEAITACQEDLAICRETGDRHSEGGALSNLGLALRAVRRFEEAITACQDAAAIYRETGDRHGEGGALNNLGLALQEVRRFSEAMTAYQDALAIYLETGDQHRAGTAQELLERARTAQSTGSKRRRDGT